MSRANFFAGSVLGSVALLAALFLFANPFESRGSRTVEIGAPTMSATDPAVEADQLPASLPEFDSARMTPPRSPTAIDVPPTKPIPALEESEAASPTLDTEALEAAIAETKKLIDENRKRSRELQREYLNLEIERSNYQFLESGETIESTPDDWTVAIKYVGGNPVGVRLRKREFPDYDATFERRLLLRNRLSKLERERDSRD